MMDSTIWLSGERPPRIHCRGIFLQQFCAGILSHQVVSQKWDARVMAWKASDLILLSRGTRSDANQSVSSKTASPITPQLTAHSMKNTAKKTSSSIVIQASKKEWTAVHSNVDDQDQQSTFGLGRKSGRHFSCGHRSAVQCHSCNFHRLSISQ